jgi:hypothetical protein
MTTRSNLARLAHRIASRGNGTEPEPAVERLCSCRRPTPGSMYAGRRACRGCGLLYRELAEKNENSLPPPPRLPV